MIMKKILAIVVLGLLWSNNSLADNFKKVYNMTCTHIYESDFKKSVIIDLKNDKIIISSESSVDTYKIKGTGSLLIGSNKITDVYAINENDLNKNIKEWDGVYRISIDAVFVEMLIEPVSYLNLVRLNNIKFSVDKEGTMQFANKPRYGISGTYQFKCRKL